jgi:hypothetical protein
MTDKPKEQVETAPDPDEDDLDDLDGISVKHPQTKTSQANSIQTSSMNSTPNPNQQRPHPNPQPHNPQPQHHTTMPYPKTTSSPPSYRPAWQTSWAS